MATVANDRELAELLREQPTQQLDAFKGVKKVPLEEFVSSGHGTCQGCESALVMKMMVKAAGPRTIVLGSTGCMYVANTTYYSTSWVVPWMHTQLGSSGSAGLGTAAGLKALMRKGKMKNEPINVIDFCGDGGGADLGVTSGVWPLYEVENGVLKLIGKTRAIADKQLKRTPVRDYLLRQGRFAHFTDDDIDYFQSKVDEMWERWLIPGVIPFRKQIEADPAPA